VVTKILKNFVRRNTGISFLPRKRELVQHLCQLVFVYWGASEVFHAYAASKGHATDYLMALVRARIDYTHDHKY
jgi:hypothetical protein